MLRVLHVIQNLNYGGMERVLADLVQRCSRSRFEIHVLCLAYFGRFSTGLGQVATLHLADSLPRYSMVWPGPLIRQIRRIRPHVVHSHSGVWYKASFAARHAGVPRLVHTDHGRPKPDRWRGRLIDGLGARRTDAIVAVSDALALQLHDGLYVPRSKIVVIPNGVDTERYAPKPDTGKVRAELGISPETPIIGSIGRLEPIKGYDVMLEAFAHLRGRWNSSPSPVLVIGGEGSDRPRLETLIKERRLEGSVYLLGWRDDVDDLQSCFALFTMSSRSEGTSISLLEAMSAGLCPVVTDVGGNAAVLGEALRDQLVETENPVALAEAWTRSLADEEGRRRIAAVARQRVIEGFGVDAMVRRYEDVYVGNHAKGETGEG